MGKNYQALSPTRYSTLLDIQMLLLLCVHGVCISYIIVDFTMFTAVHENTKMCKPCVHNGFVLFAVKHGQNCLVQVSALIVIPLFQFSSLQRFLL